MERNGVTLERDRETDREIQARLEYQSRTEPNKISEAKKKKKKKTKKKKKEQTNEQKVPKRRNKPLNQRQDRRREKEMSHLRS